MCTVQHSVVLLCHTNREKTDSFKPLKFMISMSSVLLCIHCKRACNRRHIFKIKLARYFRSIVHGFGVQNSLSPKPCPVQVSATDRICIVSAWGQSLPSAVTCFHTIVSDASLGIVISSLALQTHYTIIFLQLHSARSRSSATFPPLPHGSQPTADLLYEPLRFQITTVAGNIALAQPFRRIIATVRT